MEKKLYAQKVSADNEKKVPYNRPEITLNGDYAHPYMDGRC